MIHTCNTIGTTGQWSPNLQIHLLNALIIGLEYKCHLYKIIKDIILNDHKKFK